MSGRRKIEERIRKKEQEIAELEARIREERVYIQALNDALKMLPRGDNGGHDGMELRSGSMVARAREAIEKAGKPLHIGELLDFMGKEKSRRNRTSLAGSLAAYVRRGEIFTRPRPNTFGLVGMDDAGITSRQVPPPDFGTEPTPEDDDEISFDDEIPF